MMTGEFVKVAKQSDIPEGSAKTFDVAGKKIAICNADNTFFAIADLCSHDGGPLGSGELVNHQIECPRHGARFDINTGKAMCLPAVLPIPTYSVEVRGEELWVSI